MNPRRKKIIKKQIVSNHLHITTIACLVGEEDPQHVLSLLSSRQTADKQEGSGVVGQQIENGFRWEWSAPYQEVVERGKLAWLFFYKNFQ